MVTAPVLLDQPSSKGVLGLTTYWTLVKKTLAWTAAAAATARTALNFMVAGWRNERWVRIGLEVEVEQLDLAKVSMLVEANVKWCWLNERVMK